MQLTLTYRGTQYNTAPASINTVDSGLTATYRGLSYNVSQVWTPVAAAMPTKPLKYRGIAIGEPEVTYQPASCPAMA